MPFEKFERQPEPPAEEEKPKSEKEIQWGEKKREVGQITDALGEKVDEGIKETVIALNLLGFSTSASCEGHLKHGLPAPWVEIEASNEPDERFVGEREIIQRIADKYGVSFEEIKRGTCKKRGVYKELFDEYTKTEETPEFRAWREENERLESRIRELLEEFYKDREVSEDIRLRTDKVGFACRVHNGREEDFRPRPVKTLHRRKKELAGKLPEYQAEINAFTEFLKSKYFEK